MKIYDLLDFSTNISEEESSEVIGGIKFASVIGRGKPFEEHLPPGIPPGSKLDIGSTACTNLATPAGVPGNCQYTYITPDGQRITYNPLAEYLKAGGKIRY
jgi:hypothetical protein